MSSHSQSRGLSSHNINVTPRGGSFTARLVPCVQLRGVVQHEIPRSVDLALLFKAPTPEGNDVREPPAYLGYQRVPIDLVRLAEGVPRGTLANAEAVEWAIPDSCPMVTTAAIFSGDQLTHYGLITRSPGDGSARAIRFNARAIQQLLGRPT